MVYWHRQAKLLLVQKTGLTLPLFSSLTLKGSIKWLVWDGWQTVKCHPHLRCCALCVSRDNQSHFQSADHKHRISSRFLPLPLIRVFQWGRTEIIIASLSFSSNSNSICPPCEVAISPPQSSSACLTGGWGPPNPDPPQLWCSVSSFPLHICFKSLNPDLLLDSESQPAVPPNSLSENSPRTRPWTPSFVTLVSSGVRWELSHESSPSWVRSPLLPPGPRCLLLRLFHWQTAEAALSWVLWDAWIWSTHHLRVI